MSWTGMAYFVLREHFNRACKLEVDMVPREAAYELR